MVAFFSVVNCTLCVIISVKLTNGFGNFSYKTLDTNFQSTPRNITVRIHVMLVVDFQVL